jgi:AcrR family transcriptional regulator
MKNKRADVMQAALEIISENGFHNAPTSQIANRARVGMGTIYRYFRNKDELIHAIFTERLELVRVALREGYDTSLPLRERYLTLCRNLFDYMVNHPLDHSFHEQYSNSPFSRVKQHETLLAFEQSDNPEDYPFLALFSEGNKKKVIKNLQYPFLFILTTNPIIAMAGQCIAGLMDADDDDIDRTLAACWDAIASHEIL